MFRRRSDLPLDKDALGRFLPWLIAFMVFLAALALAGMLSLHDAVKKWDTGLNATLTVQIPPGRNAKDDERRLGEVLSLLAARPGVLRYETLSKNRLFKMLEPWIGNAGEADDLPLPTLIDVTVDRGAELNTRQLATELAARVPGTSVDDHRVWLSQLVRLVTMIQALAWAVLVLIGLATVGTVVFTTRTGLAIHREAIEVLHLIGAQDAYIARQFAARALHLGLKGGLLGIALAAPALAAIAYLATQTGATLVPHLGMTPFHIFLFVALPLSVAGLAMYSARATVLGSLKRQM